MKKYLSKHDVEKFSMEFEYCAIEHAGMSRNARDYLHDDKQTYFHNGVAIALTDCAIRIKQALNE